MSIFVDFEVKFPDEAKGVKVLAIAWCKVHPILAVSTDDGVIRFFHEEGELIKDATYKV